MIKKLLMVLLTVAIALGTKPASAAETSYYSFWSNCEFVSAFLDKDGRPFVEINKSIQENGPGDFGKYSGKFGKKQPVQGGAGKYRSIFVGIMGQNIFPYIMLLKEDRTVEYVDVIKCIESGFKFKVAGTVPNLKDVLAFESATFCVEDDGEAAGAWSVILAVGADGSKNEISLDESN